MFNDDEVTVTEELTVPEDDTEVTDAEVSDDSDKASESDDGVPVDITGDDSDGNGVTDVETATSGDATADAEGNAEAEAEAEGKAGTESEGDKPRKPKQKRNRVSRNAPKPILDENGNVIERLSSEKAMSVLEAILFANGDEVYYDQLAKIIGYPVKEAKQLAETYAKLYDNGAFPRGIRLTCYEKCCQLSTLPELGEYVTKMIGIKGEPQLSNAAMETLAIIAYNQPVTRAYIEQVRGVDSTRPITVLLDRELIEEVGRLEVIGRPRLFGVTQSFFRTFGISSLEELPSLDLFGMEGNS